MNKLRLTIMGGVVIVIAATVLMLRVPSASELKYDAVDGNMMFKQIDDRIRGVHGYSFLFDLFPAKTYKSPLDRMLGMFSLPAKQVNPFCIGIFHYQGRLEPTMVQQAHRIASDPPEEFSMPFSMYSVSDTKVCGVSGELGGSMGSMYDAAKDQETFSARLCQEFKNIEPNAHLRFNEDFVFVACESGMRMYRANDVPPMARALMLKAANTNVALAPVPGIPPAEIKNAREAFKSIR